ncbi:MAG TPA: glycosyltransferase [Segetibacter sp.]
MRIAIVHDELVRHGGAEQVLISFHKAFPEAPIYTISYNPETTFREFKSCTIKTSWFGKFVKDAKNLKRFFFPFGILAMRQLEVTGYDVVLVSTTHSAKYVKVDPDSLLITYCHTPFRLAWRPESYKVIAKAGFLKRRLFDIVINFLRSLDKKYAERTDWFLTNAREVVPRILAAYNPKRNVTVINPPVKCNNFYVSNIIGDYYLVVSRFEPYKKVDLVIEAFNKMPEKKLLIVGAGSMEAELKSMAGNNITFRSGLSSQELADVYSQCKAFIFPPLEDYGITPLEANASGRPVIAYGKGGVVDTMIPVSEFNKQKATAVFFNEQTVESLTNAISLFETYSFNPDFIRRHAEKFDESSFIDKLKSFVFTTYKNKSGYNVETLRSVDENSGFKLVS